MFHGWIIGFNNQIVMPSIWFIKELSIINQHIFPLLLVLLYMLFDAIVINVFFFGEIADCGWWMDELSGWLLKRKEVTGCHLKSALYSVFGEENFIFGGKNVCVVDVRSSLIFLKSNTCKKKIAEKFSKEKFAIRKEIWNHHLW